MIYNKSGNELNTVYNVGSQSVETAYDVSGNIVFGGLDYDLTVMTYNIQYFGGINSQTTMQQHIIDTYDADVIGLQELGTSGSMPSVGSAVLTEYPYKYIGVQTNKTALVSKTELSNIASAVFTNQASETRGYQKAYISFAGKNICWINTHLEYISDSVKYAQMGEIFTLADDEDYVIITGDFNSECEAITDNDYIGLYKQFVDAGYNLANCSVDAGFTKTWTNSATATSTNDLTYATDSIITSGNIDIVSVTFDPTKFSYLDGNPIDHIPVIARLKIN